MTKTNETKTKSQKRIRGVWTPWAEALCRVCHDESMNPRKQGITWAPDKRHEGEEPGFCTRCGKPVWLRDDVGIMTRLRKLAGGEMEQTGGMCAALNVNRIDDGAVIVTVDEFISIGVYRAKDWTSGEDCLACFSVSDKTPDKAVAKMIEAAVKAATPEAAVDAVAAVAKELGINAIKETPATDWIG